MRLVNSTKLASLQKSPGGIRNICILAHVDHGKTTLADSLVASNGIISQRLAGKLRYMDSRKDEQERGITMKSSSIALFHEIAEEEFLVNLIDSPGHVDFSTEVTTAVRLCDGAIVLVDVVEGVCAQTIVALRQAWQEDIKPILVLNKIDRIILELKLTPLDAYVHLTQILEKVNVVMAELLSTSVGKETALTMRRSRTTSRSSDGGGVGDTGTTKEPESYDWSTGLDDIDDSQIYFSPELGNVIFACALDGWGFRISDFARIFSNKVGFKESVLNATLWGDYYMNIKQKRIMKGAQDKAKKPLFVQLVLENIWAMYDAVAIRKDKELVIKMVDSLSLKVHPRDLKQTDPKHVLNAVMSKWLPLSTTILDTVCEKLPSPLQLTNEKVKRLMFSHSRNFALLPKESQDLKQYFLQCDSSDDAPVIIFVSKMFAIERKFLPENRPKVLSSEEIAARREQARMRLAERLAVQTEKLDLNATDTISENQSNYCIKDDNDNHVRELEERGEEDAFIAFARVYSGTLKKGSKLFILGPRYDPVIGMAKYPNGEGIDTGSTIKDLQSGEHVTVAEIQYLYQLMGRELEILDEVPAGNILGIGGLDDHILKTATISSTLACPPFTDLNLIAVPILRVAVEPVRTSDMGALVNGLRLLNQADPCVQILVQETGEHVLVTAGEVHLQRCVDDLRERFAKVEVSVSKPIVPFRETIIEPPKTDMVNELIENQHLTSDSKKSSKDDAEGLIIQKTSNKKCCIKIRAAPLPNAVTAILEKALNLLTILKDNESLLKSGKMNSLSDTVQDDIHELQTKLVEVFENERWDPGTVNKIWSFGPKKCGPNILINNLPDYKKGCVWPTNIESDTEEKQKDSLSSFDSTFINGFQLATLAGPLCEEPMVGVAFIVEDWTIESDDCDNLHQPFGPFSGQVMSTVKDACRKAFQAQPQRLMVAMYSCSIQVNSEVLGKLYAVLGKRGGRILHGDLQEGSTNFEVTAQLPVIESFDFANEVRRQTSGLALPQLVFSGWEAQLQPTGHYFVMEFYGKQGSAKLYIVLEIDPFWQPTTEEEYLHFGEKADTENRARKYMNGVRKRKGLRVEEKTVQFAEKQRTLTKNK